MNIDPRHGCCEHFVQWWVEYWQRHPQPVAVMECEDYYERLSANGRKKVRQGSHHYEYREFSFHNEVDGIAAANHSMPVRGGDPMRGWYLSSAEEMRAWTHRREGALLPADSSCELHRELWYGGFAEDGSLACYCNLGCLGNLGCLLYIIRHGEAHVSALNGLLDHVAKNAKVEFLTYHVMEHGGPGRETFKRSVGFAPVELRIRPAAS